MQSQQPQSSLDESSSDNANSNILRNIQSQDPLFNLHSPQNSMYNNTSHGIHIPLDYSADLEAAKQQQHNAKINGYGPPYRTSTSFNSFPNANRTRHSTASAVLTNSNPYRDASSSFYPTSADVFPPQMTSPTQSHMQPYDSRASFDYGAGQSNQVGVHKPSYGMVDYGNNSSSSVLLQSHQVAGKPGTSSHPQQQQLGGYSQQPPQFVNGLHISSQTPYGPHVPTNGPPVSVNGTGATSTTGAPAGIPTPGGMNLGNGGGVQTNPSQEEISTIFVVGFPEDMQEREFQNMFTFSSGFEAATLKIPNKEYTSYSGGVGAGVPPNGLRPTAGAGYLQGYGGSNDPYNLVTVNQGGVVVDGGRDGTMASWPASVPGGDDGGGGGHYMGGGGGGGGGMSMPPRKQIIGFAKFRTREEALSARDVLQGRRVDIEKGAVLKAEMAKKNLHTKRGVGPVPGISGIGSGGGVGSGGGGSISGIGGMGLQQPMINGVGLGSVQEASYGMTVMGGEMMSARERELGALGAMGLGMGAGRMNQWRDQMQDPNTIPNLTPNPNNSNAARDREEEERRREREVGAINAMGLGVGSSTRGPRDRVEEDERERRRKEKEMRLRAGNSTAFDAFHSVPLQPNSKQTPNGSTATTVTPSGSNSMVTPTESGVGVNSSPMLGNGLTSQSSVASSQVQQDDGANRMGPWDRLRKGSAVVTSSNVPLQSSSQRSSSPINPPSTTHSHSSPAYSAPRTYSPSFDNFTPNQCLPYHEKGENNGSNHHLHHHGQSESSSSSVAGESQSGGSSGHDGDISRGVGGLALTTNHGTTSPQLPSPASGASSGSASTRNVVDQNPPINTLYVGNLPTSSPPPGYPHDHLEESLRELFAMRPGFRRLCFRQKNNGPMCFVEFEDVNHATKSLNDLYGNTLNGLIKGGGIRLSYSKNPLGVRTPTSTGSTASSLQQQQQNNSNQGPGVSSFPLDPFQLGQQQQADDQRSMMSRRDMTAISSPPLPPPSVPSTSSYSSFLASPPPRFYSSSPSSNFGTSSTTLTSTSSTFLPRNNLNLQGYSLASSGSGSLSTFSPFGISTPPHSTIPDQTSADQPHNEQPHQHNFMHRTLSPPANNVEAARAG